MIPEVYKKPESQGFHHNFPATHKSYNSAVEFSVALANHDMRKTWRSHGPKGHDTALNRLWRSILEGKGRRLRLMRRS